MANVTLWMDTIQLTKMLDEMDAHRIKLEEELATVQTNIDNIRQALTPDRERVVLSDSGHEMYLVKFHADRATGSRWTCSCPSYQYQQGLDASGGCKHIRRVQATESWGF